MRARSGWRDQERARERELKRVKRASDNQRAIRIVLSRALKVLSSIKGTSHTYAHTHTRTHTHTYSYKEFKIARGLRS